MNRRRTSLMKAAMNALHYTGASDLMAPFTRGIGVIFTLHRVRPDDGGSFAPNRLLEVRPEFLDETIGLVLDRGFDVVSLDEMHARLVEGDFDRPFAAFTFDDGYRDNLELAYPVFRRRGLPFAIYVPTDFPDGRGDLWWIKLERVIAEAATVEINMDGVWSHFDTATAAGKHEAFERIYWWLRGLPSEEDARQAVGSLCERHGIDLSGLCREAIMSWDEVRGMAADPLVTIGAHTRRHLALSKLTLAEAALEIDAGVRRLEAELGRPVQHLSYPYGDAGSAGAREFSLARELGLKTAVTTRKGLLHPEHSGRLTALPRVSLNGEFQEARYVKVMLTGAPFAFLGVASRTPFARADAA
jgi:peptidoglycan/xylan/chitin deacetylase (PgdA/CDA1 family)